MNRVLNEETAIRQPLAATEGWSPGNHHRLPESRGGCRVFYCLRSAGTALFAATVMTLAGAVFAEDGAPSEAVPAKPARAEPSDEAAPTLPYGYKPPAEIPPGASSDEEWIVTFGDGDKRAMDQARRDFFRVITRGNFESPEDRANFEKYIQWRLAQLTLREYLTVNDKQQEIGNERKKLVGDVARARDAGETVFKAYLDTLVKETPNLFKYHFVSRLNGAWILAELNETEANNGNPAVPYLPAAQPLLDLLKQDQQLEGVRVPAVRGLARVIRDGQPTEQMRNDIIAAFVNELQNGDPQHDVLPAVIAEELGKLGIVNGSDRTPVVVHALTHALADKRRGFRTRSEAAAALGRLPLDNSINVSLIAYEIAALAQEMSQAFQEDAAEAKMNNVAPNYAAWKRNFMNLYFAFEGDTHENVLRGHGLNRKDLNAAIKRSINGAYNQVLPLVAAILKEKPIEEQHLNNIQQWLQANAPQSRKVHDSFKEIISGDGQTDNDESGEPVKVSTSSARNAETE